MELSEFLLARIAEDEAAVAEYVEKWGPLGGGWSSSPLLADDEYASMLIDPRRILAECEAKRRVVEAYEKNRDRIESNARDHAKASTRGDLSALPTLRSAGWDLAGRNWALAITLFLLALPYADHPDYDPAWRL